MSLDYISFTITTRSNLFIGGTPQMFEIGGVDLYTVTDFLGKPYIPASSWKGALRTVVHDLVHEGPSHPEAEEIGKSYENYLCNLKEQNMKQAESKGIEQERIDRMQNRFDELISHASAEYLFGMEGFNRSPKLIFHDLQLSSPIVGTVDSLFSIDSKNTIEIGKENVSAKPRSYKTVRPGVSFTGMIDFYLFHELQIQKETVKSFITDAMEQFNQGTYRLGNSGSRGYGKIKVECS